MIPGNENPNSPMLQRRPSGSWYVLLRPASFVPFLTFHPQQQTPLLHHYHPAISLHARQLLSAQPLTASADLSLNTISHFLDRFVYKNPKKVKPNANNANVVIGKGKGASAMQPAASGLEGGGVKLMKGEMGDMEERVNEGVFLRKKESDVPVDQVRHFSYCFRVEAFTDGLRPSFSSTNSSPERTKRKRPSLPRPTVVRTGVKIPIQTRTRTMKMKVEMKWI